MRQQLKRLENCVQRVDCSLAMKSHLLLTTIAAVLLVGCGNSEADRALLKDAKFGGNIEAVKQHLASGADVNAKKMHVMLTPLHFAAQNNSREVAQLLVAEGAKHGVINGAVAGGNIEAVKKFLPAGKDVNRKDRHQKTSLDVLKDNPEIRDLLRKHGGKTAEELKAEGK